MQFSVNENLQPRTAEEAEKYAARPRKKPRREPSEVTGATPQDGDRWLKPCNSAAFHGLAGEFVALVEPHSEADPAGLLAQFLVSFGNVVGRTVYRTAGGAKHYLNLFAALVGKTSKSRKGSSWADVKRLFELVDPDWCRRCVIDGLATGEGLIHAVRDGRDEDEGVKDKRILVIEAEFARVLTMTIRKENTLSPVVRAAWDSGDLNVLTKKSPASARGAHISIIGHITRDELIRNLNSTEIANGFANRFLWLAVHRSKELPFGGNLAVEQLTALADRVRAAADFPRSLESEMEFSKDAAEKWTRVYGPLSRERDGLVGAIVSRAEAQTLRLACLYATLDCSRAIQPVHLEAALALWEYCERSARFIFGDSLGDPVADAILAALSHKRPGSLTRTEISSLFGHNVGSDRIHAALELLHEKHLALKRIQPTNGGRPVEHWKATEPPERLFS